MTNCCGPKEAEKFMVYRSRLDSQEALLLRSYLEGAGITVWLTSEHMTSMNYAVSADLMIRENDKWRADQVMAELSKAPAQTVKVDMGDLQECHHCGSYNVFNYVGDVPVWGGFAKSRAFPGSPWRKCLQCEGFFRVDEKRLIGKMPLALSWGVLLAAFVWILMWVINWLKVIL